MFDIYFLRNIGGEVTTDGDFLMFEGNRYNRKGFLFKIFPMSAIVSRVSSTFLLLVNVIRCISYYFNRSPNLFCELNKHCKTSGVTNNEHVLI